MTREMRQYARLRLIIILVGGVFFASALLTLRWLWPIIQSAMNPLKIACGCAVMAIRSPWWVNAIGLFTAGAILFLIGRFLFALSAHLLASRRQIRDLCRSGVRPIIHQPSGRCYNLITSTEPVAVTIGLLRPQIYLSTGLLGRLTSAEVAAVLAHERAHQRAGDPLSTAVMDSLAQTFRWLPRATGWAAAAYSLRELAADAYATDDYRSTQALSSAFLKLTDTVPLAHGNAFSPNRDRIEKLLDRNWSPRLAWWNWATVGVLAAALTALLAVGRYAKAIAPAQPSAAAASACHQTIVMCQAKNWVTPPPQTVCGTGRCASVEHPWSPAYVISFNQ